MVEKRPYFCYFIPMKEMYNLGVKHVFQAFENEIEDWPELYKALNFRS